MNLSVNGYFVDYLWFMLFNTPFSFRLCILIFKTPTWCVICNRVYKNNKIYRLWLI